MRNWEKVNDVPRNVLRENPQLCIVASLVSKKKYKPSDELLVNNSKLVDKYIKEWSQLLLWREDQKFIIATQDNDYIKECIKNREEFIRASNYGMIVSELIETLGDNKQEIMKEFIQKKDEYNFDSFFIASVTANVINGAESSSFIKNIIDERDKYNFTSNDIIAFIKETKDTEYIKKCISHPEFCGLEKKDVEYLVRYTHDLQFIINYVKENPLDDSVIKKFKLPEGMTIGIEIESEGMCSSEILQLDTLLEEWKTKEDKSLEEGVEVVSPVLKSEYHRENEIYDICRILQFCHNYPSERCGGHIHIGADYLKSVDAWKNLVEIWANTENIWYIISNRKGEAPRDKVFKFARPFSGKILDAFEKGEIEINDEDDIESFCQELIKVQERNGEYARFSGINFTNFGFEEKNTIEFRVANGNVDPIAWIENINLFGGLIAVSQELAEIQQKLEQNIEITKEEEKKINIFEKIRTTNDERN